MTFRPNERLGRTREELEQVPTGSGAGEEWEASEAAGHEVIPASC
jgi:hypothetical protein